MTDEYNGLVLVGLGTFIFGCVLGATLSYVKYGSDPIELCGTAIMTNGTIQPLRLISQPGIPIVLRNDDGRGMSNVTLYRCSELVEENPR